MASSAPALARVVLLTGGSQGYGRALAEELTSEAVDVGRRLHLVLVARGADGLAETKEASQALVRSSTAGTDAGITCRTFVADLGTPASIEAAIEPVFLDLEAAIENIVLHSGDALPAVELVLIHNSGTLGRLAFTEDLTVAEAAAAMDLNVTGVIVLTQLFLKRFGSRAKLPNNALQLQIVNISSLLALQPMPSWSLYATGKAARDMLMRSVDADLKARGIDGRTLSWAPGPMYTAMVQEVLATCPDAGIASQFRQMHEEGKMVDTRQSAGQLVRLLAQRSYESGSHVDFFDVSSL
eukprot:TRINITY_DN30397_c0_g2_i1.p1 TRINITY_DN30397_c0_g2~~TRINITY_DN30397_c0_g2_i1.p1  ORF type:complete len:297 (-),score=68.18 TRINITY_DN30397_c0_g2_i1:36-926(-)